MSIFTKSCSICGRSIFVLGGKKLSDGCYCNECSKQLSPFFVHSKRCSIADMKRQIELRTKNELIYKQFVPTDTIGNENKLLVDNLNQQFVVILAERKYKKRVPDVISFSQITNCKINVIEEKDEVQYTDSNNKTKSFSPPYFAYSYDFYVDISVNSPYIGPIRIKINKEPIDNDQSLIIDMPGGAVQKIKDAFGSAKSYNGKTSNSDEVKSSAEYIKCNEIANEMRNVLLEGKKAASQRHQVNRCPWCNSILAVGHTGNCDNCGGAL